MSTNLQDDKPNLPTEKSAYRPLSQRARALMYAVLLVGVPVTGVIAAMVTSKPASVNIAVADDVYAGHQAYYRGQFQIALQNFERHALAGDAEAAERAGLMLLVGQTLYGEQVQANHERAAVFLAEAAQAGRAGAQAALNLLGSTD